MLLFIEMTNIVSQIDLKMFMAPFKDELLTIFLNSLAFFPSAAHFHFKVHEQNLVRKFI